ncbi:helix-turn-helix domain-containing protein [Thalassospira sp. MCCC 1A01428]|jgi:lambda repressor-like predicted transcriptional regulator|uniref:helix-turn-helix domain-containing protein n=1 Tax=Thalassospira sp. MCCC 1A01428 TaxID=1470575 RepID=UPI000A2002FB|nr:helix-turn-helix domain-containing protein [Thalassospira sp. MCCC 1A01428]
MSDALAVAGDMPPGMIRYKLEQRGYTYADVERQYGLPARTACKAAVVPYFHGEMAIAEVLGLSPRQIWPSRFDMETGARLKPQPAENYSHTPRLRHCLKGEAA